MTELDLLTIQFDKWGGGFVIEIPNGSTEGIVMPWGEQIPPIRVRAWDVYPRNRPRLGSPKPEEDEKMAIGSDSTGGRGLITRQAVS